MLSTKGPVFGFGATVCLSLISCAGNLNFPTLGTTSQTNSTPSQDQLISAQLPGARINFHYTDFFTLENPNSNSCAGDAKNYYHPMAMTLPSYSAGYMGLSSPLVGATGPMLMPVGTLDATTSIRPSWLKNISVDITNANTVSSLNAAYQCSLGSANNVNPASSCASFDYAALGGSSSNLGGQLIFLGGISGVNSNGTAANNAQTVSCGPVTSLAANTCNAGMYSIGINVLPASAATNPASTQVPGITGATGSISTWTKLSGVVGFSGPRAFAGASVVVNPTLGQAIAFGGSTVLAGLTAPTSPAAASSDLWTFDLKTRAWTLLTPNLITDSQISNLSDVSDTQNQLWAKDPTARALMGYVPVQGYALSGMSSQTSNIGDYGKVLAANIDKTDRLMIVGGNNSYGYDTHRFNPTYGPDFVDMPGATPRQWLDSNPTQIAFNQDVSTWFYPALGTGPTGPALGAAFAAARNNSGPTGAGYIVSAGGFTATTRNSTTGPSGGLMIFNRGGHDESSTAAYTSITNDLSGVSAGTGSLPATLPTWASHTSTASINWFGGSSLVPGFNLKNNEFIYFGGTDCSGYLTTQAGCSFNTSSKYFSLGIQASSSTAITPTATAGTAPPKAGMNTARGLDGAGYPIIIAYGGVIAAGSTGSTQSEIYYLYNSDNTATGTPTWNKVTATGTSPPTAVADGSLVYSHFSKKFYLFGGYSTSTAAAVGTTWELSAYGTGAGMNFVWRALDTAGLTCSPSCPQARRGHRMAEVNYYNTNPGGTMTTSDGENACNAASPCSMALFMEGGTSDGTNFLSDRWIFDPSANQGAGHWLKMGDLPPRVNGAMSAVDYWIPSRNSTAHRALLFGGETGMQNPAQATNAAANSRVFIPPTLGDTWIYDFDAKTWNRVRLLGKGYHNNAVSLGLSGKSVSEIREAYDATESLSHANELAPPALAGAQMVTRTFRNLNHNLNTQPAPLILPEVFLFGGRQKDGSYLQLDHVYKFCIGSTGEKPFPQLDGTLVAGSDDASCDAYDSTNNPLSPSPTNEFKGRWIRKGPLPAGGFTPTNESSYLGAATYDSRRDRIISYGGFKGSDAGLGSAGHKITEDLTHRILGTTILEYTPPSRTYYGSAGHNTQYTEGQWATLPTCAASPSSPVGRYGHTINYDALNDRLVVVGGLNWVGTPLTQTLSPSGSVIPEIWTATRDDANTCYNWNKISTFGNDFSQATSAPSSTGISHAGSFFVPSDGYTTGFYTMLDHDCTNAGPITSGDAALSRILAGGASLDIDRTQLGANENLLLNLTYIPMGIGNQRPDGTPLTSSESAVFRIHLIKTGMALGELQMILQPRYLSFDDTSKYPQIVESLSVLAPADGQIRQEQILLPISADPLIDRIRIERYSGTGILIDATLVRMGKP